MIRRVGVLTSGGDAPGMNAAVRAVVRSALDRGAEVYAIYEGYKGMIAGGDMIRPMNWNSVGGILHRGGTVIGTARCLKFLEREGRRTAARNLVERGIDALVVIGGDGSLTGANLLRQEWPDLLAELVERGEIDEDTAHRHRYLTVAGLVGSIDNDMYGTDMTIGADTALHRITAAVDAITSTAASHQRAFVVEVMGRQCGYLAVMSALATGAEWVLIPEHPPSTDDRESAMVESMREGVLMGRRENIVIVAEGAIDRKGNPITCDYVAKVISERLNEDVRVTVLGHVQRGGSPSAYDRILSTVMGVEAVDVVLTASENTDAILVGVQDNKVVRLPLMYCVEQTNAINAAIRNLDFERAMELRGRGFLDAFRIMRTLVRSRPSAPKASRRRLRIGILNAGGPAPGMNSAVRATVRLAVDAGHECIGFRRGFRGLINNDVVPLEWMSVNGWAPLGGSELGTSRKVPKAADFYSIAWTLEINQVDALIMIGGWTGYRAALTLYEERAGYPSFNIPVICVPATINNSVPFAEYSIGADTALNSILDVVDKIKQSAVASNRCFVVEVMGRYCGYLALMSAISSGAERVYLHEEGIRLQDLEQDLDLLRRGFEQGKRLGLMIRNEKANALYTTEFIAALFEEEGGDLFDVRTSVLGHLQQGGNSTPFDRILAARMAARAVDLVERAYRDDSRTFVGQKQALCVGLAKGAMNQTPLEEVMRQSDLEFDRPKEQWWMELRGVADVSEAGTYVAVAFAV